MNEVMEKSTESQSETDKSSGAWIRAQFQDNVRDDEAEPLSEGVNKVRIANNDEQGPLQELDGSLQQLAAALLRVGEQPARVLQEAWSQDLTVLDGRLSTQAHELETATNGIANLEGTVEKLRTAFSEREDRYLQVTSQVEQLSHRMDALEADLSRRLGQFSSSIENLQSELSMQRTGLDTLRQESDRRMEVAQRVSQVLDSLKTSVNMLAEPEPRAS